MKRALFILVLLVSPAQAENVFEAVPTAMIEYQGIKQISVVGTYCWHFDGEAHQCVDTGLVSPVEPMVIPASASLEITMPNQDDLTNIQYSVVSVTENSYVIPQGYSNRAMWKEGASRIENLEVQKELQVPLKLSPGLHVLSVSAWWSNHDDASHGFLLRVEAEIEK